MLDAGRGVRIYVAAQPQDMRKSFTGLAGAVTEVLGKDPKSGHLFAFVNRRRNLVKILSWDENGFCLLCKRLSSGIFSLPECSSGSNHIEIATKALSGLVKARHVVASKDTVTFRDGRIVFERKCKEL